MQPPPSSGTCALTNLRSCLIDDEPRDRRFFFFIIISQLTPPCIIIDISASLPFPSRLLQLIVPTSFFVNTPHSPLLLLHLC